MRSNYPGIKLEPVPLGSDKKTKLNIGHHMLTSFVQLQNRSFHVVERTRTSAKCPKMKNARTQRLSFFIIKYGNLRRSYSRRRSGCLNSLLSVTGGKLL